MPTTWRESKTTSSGGGAIAWADRRRAGEPDALLRRRADFLWEGEVGESSEGLSGEASPSREPRRDAIL